MVISGINTMSDISKLFYVFMPNITYKSCYYLSILLPTRFVIFTCRYFKLSWNTTALSQSNCRNFSCSSINSCYETHTWNKQRAWVTYGLTPWICILQDKTTGKKNLLQLLYSAPRSLIFLVPLDYTSLWSAHISPVLPSLPPRERRNR